MSNGGGQTEPMADDYRFDSAEDVLSYVFNGIRFPAMFGHEEMDWSGVYNGKYFYYRGNMQDAFERFNRDFDNIAMKVARKYLRTFGYY